MAESTPSDTTPFGNRGAMIILAYLWILALVPLLAEKRDREVQWHARHGIVLLAAEIFFWTAFSLLTSFMSAIAAVFGYLLGLLAPLIWLSIVVVHVLAILKGLNGQRLMIPGLSQYANLR